MAPRTDRIGATDHTELLTDVGPVPKHVAALLLVEHSDAAALAAVLARRLARIDRFRDRLEIPRNRLRRPSWTPDGAFDVARHLATVEVPARPGVDRLIAVALGEATRVLPRDRPLWRAAVLASPDGRAHGVALVMHHVLADGLGGLAALRSLVDGSPAGERSTLESAAASPARSRDRSRDRDHHRARHPHPLTRAPATSVNSPTGPRREVHVARADLAALLAGARAAGATVNDCLLVAATSALERVLRARGEAPRHLVASVLISRRGAADHGGLGNRIGVMAVPVELSGGPAVRLARVAATTRALKARPRAAALAVGPALRVVAAAGALTWFVDRQRMVTTFVTNVRGPADRWRLAHASIDRIVPLTSLAGNVAVAFAAPSYAGALEVSVITDPDVVPEGEQLARTVAEVLGALSRTSP